MISKDDIWCKNSCIRTLIKPPMSQRYCAINWNSTRFHYTCKIFANTFVLHSDITLWCTLNKFSILNDLLRSLLEKLTLTVLAYDTYVPCKTKPYLPLDHSNHLSHYYIVPKFQWYNYGLFGRYIMFVVQIVSR